MTGVVNVDNHGLNPEHLPPSCYGLRLMGKARVTNPSGAGLKRRVGDVAAYGNYAFLTAWREPTWQRTGVHVIDVNSPAEPFEVLSAFMETTPGNYVGDGPSVLEIDNEYFSGALLIFGNEVSAQADAPDPTGPGQRGGINVYDISDPEHPELLAAHAGNYTDADGEPADQAMVVYFSAAWTDSFTGRSYVGLVTDKPTTDIDIVEITDPRNPVMVDSLDLKAAPFGVTQDTARGLTSLFGHAVGVRRVGDRYVMSATYWDGGYVLLDVTDPAKVSLIARTEYAEYDEERAKHAEKISPKGNAEHCELSPDADYLVGADQDFNPYRLLGTITSGPHAGTQYIATWGPDTAPVDADDGLSGTTTLVGLGCPGTVAPGRGIALIERNASILTGGSAEGCSFQEKLNAVTEAGYQAGIIFNHQGPDAMQQFPPGAEGSIPLLFVNRLTGLQLLGVPGVTEATAGTTPTPTTPEPSRIEIKSVFDGWGYLRLYQTDIPQPAGTGSMTHLDTYAIPESQDPAFATGFGDLSASHVAIDPDRNLVYATFFTGGLRVLSYGEDGLREVGSFSEPGNDFLGVAVHKIGEKNFVLVSDRNFGLYIFDV